VKDCGGTLMARNLKLKEECCLVTQLDKNGAPLQDRWFLYDTAKLHCCGKKIASHAFKCCKRGDIQYVVANAVTC